MIQPEAMQSDAPSSSIEYSLLGLLGQRPMHGYELHRELGRKTGLGLIWTVKQAQVYAILTKLEARGLIEVELLVQGKRPARRVFHLTASGGQAYEAWLGLAVGRREFRLDFLAKLYFARRRGGDAAMTLLAAQRKLCALWLDEMREGFASCSGGDLDELVYRFRIGQIEAMIAWLDECGGVI
jgi:PadR family transcriptional regulator AphA